MRNLVIGVAAVGGFIVAQVMSSVITTALRPDPVKDRRRDEPPAVVTAAQLPRGSVSAKPQQTKATTTTTPERSMQAPSTEPAGETPVAAPPEPVIQVARPPAPQRGPGNLDAPVYIPPPPRAIGPGNL